MQHKIYILDDDPVFAKIVSANLGRAGEFRTRTFEHPTDFLEAVSAELPDAVLTDLVMPDIDGIEVTRKLRATAPLMPIFVLTAKATIESAVEAVRAGANDYFEKPVNVTELTALLRRSLEDRRLKEEATEHRQDQRGLYSPDTILGDHPKVREVRKFVTQVAAAPQATVQLLGESGTGKNLVARAIHYGSDQSEGGRLIEVNCSALPANLLEAELFGYRKGAFTDAKESKRGLVELADGGTLFLDEIGDMPLELQAKVLGFLESRSFRRLGGTEDVSVDLRIITATSRNLDQMAAEGSFRQDLLYRIRVATLELPPLREIRSDIPALADHFCRSYASEFRKDVTGVAPDALEVLMDWHWPGNVRELRNVFERAMIFADGPRLLASDLPPLTDPGQPRTESGLAGVIIPHGKTLVDVERAYIAATLDHYDGSVQRAAEYLGISRKNLWEKRKKHGLSK